LGWPTRRSSGLLAIAALLAAAVLSLWWLGGADTTSSESDTPSDPPSAGGTGSSGSSDPIADYREFASAFDPGTATTAQLIEGLRTLGGAVGVATAGEASAAIDLRIAAEHIELSPDDYRTTTFVRSSLVSAADALGDTALRSSADSIDPRSTIAAQRTAIATALERAAAALER
jgi:hypothetical protein